MKEEKNLDRLFQEKFKDFERHPSDTVWKNIVAIKDEKEDRKVVPLWWRLAGSAAVIAILLTTGIILFSDTENTLDNKVVTTQTPENTSPPETAPSKTENDNNVVVDQGGNPVIQKDVIISTPNVGKANNNTVVKNNEQRVMVATNGNAPTTFLNKLTTPKNDVEGFVNTDNSPSKNTSNTFKEIKKDSLDVNAVVSNTNEGISEDATEDKISLIEEAKRIEDQKNEEEAVALLDDPTNNSKWNVGAVTAPVYYGDFGGSGIDPTFSDSNKSGNVNFSYGVQVSYAVSPKLKVRTGISDLDLSYNTDGIIFTPNTNARRLNGIRYSENAQALNIIDRSAASALENTRDGIIENNLQTNVLGGSLEQRIGFVEIPVEAVYTISNNRLGIQVVGGMSTLLLNNNEVLLNSDDGLQSNLGSANGLNDVSFTTNIGLGLNYKMTDKFNLNVEPSFKYQLNAFDESVGNFKPYYVGIYTGVNYRF